MAVVSSPLNPCREPASAASTATSAGNRWRDARGWLTVVWACVMAVLYARMVIEQRAPWLWQRLQVVAADHGLNPVAADSQARSPMVPSSAGAYSDPELSR